VELPVLIVELGLEQFTVQIVSVVCTPASCGKFAEIPADLYKKYVHRRLDYFLRDNSNCFHCTSQAATFENQFWTGFDLTRFSSTIFNKFQPFDIFRSHVSSITERSKDTKHFTVMFVGNTELSNLSS
jgi:hypothetical protein